VVHADAPRLGQILRNLIENALVHAPGSPVRIEAGTPADRAAGERSDDALVELAVTDEGPGIAPEHVPFVFDRLYRADPSRTRATGGAGLGLAIVRELVEAHGGRVGVERTPAGGARVWLTLPGTARDAGA
jgi:signal transduction histidine kinase